MDVFFFEAFSEEEQTLRNLLPAHISAEFSWKTIQEYGHPLPEAKIISTRTQSEYPMLWDKIPDGILSRSTGYDHLSAYLKKTAFQIKCGYLPLYCHRAVAEHALMLWMALLRKLPLQIQQFQQFNRNGLTGKEASGKNLVVFGVGNIGYEVCKIGKGLEMNVFGVEIDIKHPDINYISKEEGIAIADIIVCAMNLTDDNHNYFTAELLKKSKQGAIFINISRGEISPSAELLKVSDHLGGIGLDVFDEEKDLAALLRSQHFSGKNEVKATLELLKKNHVICTPHNAFNSAEGVLRKSEQSIQQIIHFLTKGDFIWKVPFN